MAGGILQIVAQGIENGYLTDTPQITFFKTVYRRHSNFAKVEQNLTFNNKLTFGTNAVCNIKHFGDLISRLILVIELPEILLEYNELTNKQLQVLLQQYDIVWTYDTGRDNILITESELEQVVGKLEYINGKLTRTIDGMILDKVDELIRTIEKDSAFIQELEDITSEYEQNGNTNVEQYVDELLLRLLLISRNLSINDEQYIDNEDYYNQYAYFYSYKKDYSTLLPRPVIWLEPTNNIIRYIDPRDGIPTAPSIIDGNRFICAYSDRGWVFNNVYKYQGGTWSVTTPQIYTGNIVTEGYTNMGLDRLKRTVGWSDQFSVIGFYNPNDTTATINDITYSFSGPPDYPNEGDTYISLADAVEPTPWSDMPHWPGIPPYRNWLTNEMWRCTQTAIEGNPYSVVWEKVDVPIGAYVFVTGGSVYYKRMIFKNNQGQWEELATSDKILRIMYDGTAWRKSIISFYDPVIVLPTNPKIGDRYISLTSNNGWTKNHIYTWSGWIGVNIIGSVPNCVDGWLDVMPSNEYGVYVESGSVYPGSIVIYNNIERTWKQIDITVPMYNWNTFKQLLYATLRDKIFTDSNIKLLYGIEFCNTTVLPSMASQQMRPFFDNIVSTEIQASSSTSYVIDEECTLWIRSYDPFFTNINPSTGKSIGESFVGSYENLISVQTKLLIDMRDIITTEVLPDIDMFITLFNRLQYSEVETSVPLDHYPRFIYYKRYPYSGGIYDNTQPFYDCPPSIYWLESTPKPLQDYFLSKIESVYKPINYPSDGYIYKIIDPTRELLGAPNGSSIIHGSFYNIVENNPIIQEYFYNFFTYVNPDPTIMSKYAEVKNTLLVHSNLINPTDPSTYNIYNIVECFNHLAHADIIPPNPPTTYNIINDQIFYKYRKFFYNLRHSSSLGATKGPEWGTRLNEIINHIHAGLRTTIVPTTFPSYIWDGFDGFGTNAIYDVISGTPNDLLVLFIFKYFLAYDVHKMVPSNLSLIPESYFNNPQLQNKNAVEFISLTYQTNLEAYIFYYNSTVSVANQLTDVQMDALMFKIRRISCAYTGANEVYESIEYSGLKEWTSYVINHSNILPTEVPELYYTGTAEYVDTPDTFTPVPVDLQWTDSETTRQYFRRSRPYDAITSITSIMLNRMKALYNLYFSNPTDGVMISSIYESMGNPFKNAIELIPTSFSGNYYTDGNQLYLDIGALINQTIGSFNNDYNRYNDYTNLLHVKYMNIDNIQFKYASTLEMLVHFHTEIYNNRQYYIGSTITYEDAYNNIILPSINDITPLLSFYNEVFGIYASPIDLLYVDTTNRKTYTNYNPYRIVTSPPPGWKDNYRWYQETVIDNTNSILNLETIIIDTMERLFAPYGVGLIEFFTNNINNPTNPFINGTYLWQWYNNLVTSKVSTEITKMYKLFGLPYSRPYINGTVTTNEYAITPQSLYNDEANININYNRFATNKDFIQYLMDHILKYSSIGDVKSLTKATIQETFIAFTNYYQIEKSNCSDLIDKIGPYTVGSDLGNAVIPYRKTKLEDLIMQMYNRENVNFAWIKMLGHYMIDYVDLKIGDELIDHHTGEYLHLKTILGLKSEKIKGYNKMIGNIPELYTFNNKKKYKYKLFVPLRFTFCEYYKASLPLICLNNTDVFITVRMKDFTDVAYWDTSGHFIKKPQLNCSMIADYILLDKEERMSMASQKIETLYEYVQYNGDTVVNMAELSREIDYDTYREVKSFYDPINGLPINPVIGEAYISSRTETGWIEKTIYEWNGSLWNSYPPNKGDSVLLKDSTTDPKKMMLFDGRHWINKEETTYICYNLRLGFIGLSKELIFVVQTKDKIDGSLPNGEKRWDDYLVDLPVKQVIVDNQYITEYSRVNPIASVEIKFNGRERENTKDIKFYNLIQRFAFHSCNDYDGINVYSFALEPESLQPTGIANFSKIDNVDLCITFIPQLARLINTNKKIVRIGVYNESCNILRIMSGMAGAAFYP